MIFRVTAAAFAAALLSGSAALAAPDFSKADCASPAFKAFIHARLGHGKVGTSQRLSPDRFNYGPIVSARTVSRSADGIECDVSVDLDTPGGMHPVRGRFSASRGGWRWQPAY